MLGIPAQLDRDAVFDPDPHQAGVGAIERADAFRHGLSGG
jgi:hypothetical protein